MSSTEDGRCGASFRQDHEGLKEDIKRLPLATDSKNILEEIKLLQNKDFARFVESYDRHFCVRSISTNLSVQKKKAPSVGAFALRISDTNYGYPLPLSSKIVGVMILSF